MMMSEKEYLERKYYRQIMKLKKNNIWTLFLIKYYLHLDHSTVEKMVEEKILYSFKISRCKFYSPYDREYSNEQIRKEYLKTLFYQSYGWSSIHIPDFTVDKSLIGRNVDLRGWFDIDGKQVFCYGIYLTKPLTTVQDFKKLERLLQDIYDFNFYSDWVYVYIFSYGSQSDEALRRFIENSSKLAVYGVGQHLQYEFHFVNPTFIKYVLV